MESVNAFISGILGAVLSPFRDVAPLVSLALLSVPAALAMLLVVKHTSNQARLASVKRGIQACLYEIRLFSDDPRAVLRALGEMLRHNLTYLRLSLGPLLILALPFGFVLTHLDAYYGTGELVPGRAVLIKVRMKEPSAGAPQLAATAGVKIETPAVWIPSLREAVWRISAEGELEADLTVTAATGSVTKAFTSASGVVRRSISRPDSGILSQLRHPAERPIPGGSGIESVTVTYPARGVSVVGWELHWLVVFFVLSLVLALIFRAPMKVVI